MTVHATPAALDVLFGPCLKLVTAAADQAAAAALCAGAAAPGVDRCIFHPARGDSPPLLTAGSEDGPSAPLVAPPSGLCLLLALSAEGAAALHAFTRWWTDNGPQPAPAPLDLSGTPEPAQQRAALYRALTCLTLDELHRAAGRETQLTGQLAELRQLNEQNRAAIETMQAHLQRLQVVPYQLGTLLLPSGTNWGPGNARGAVVRQRVPGGAEGFAGLDLCCASQARGDGQLLITLHARETPDPLGRWLLPYGDLGRGWFRCSLPTALRDPLHHLEARITFETTRGSAPELALGAPEPWPEMLATVDGRPLTGSLALLTWAATPGARVGASAGYHAEEGEVREVQTVEYRLTEEDFQRFELTTPSTIHYYTPLVDVGGFRVHPIGPTPAGLRLPQGCPPGTERLVAVAQVRNEQARFPVEYALCLTDARAGCKAFPEAPDRDPRVLGFSGWQAVPPDQKPHAVVLHLDRPLPVLADLHVATRLGVGQDILYHWADWLEVRVQLRPGVPAAA